MVPYVPLSTAIVLGHRRMLTSASASGTTKDDCGASAASAAGVPAHVPGVLRKRRPCTPAARARGLKRERLARWARCRRVYMVTACSCSSLCTRGAAWRAQCERECNVASGRGRGLQPARATKHKRKVVAGGNGAIVQACSRQASHRRNPCLLQLRIQRKNGPALRRRETAQRTARTLHVFTARSLGVQASAHRRRAGAARARTPARMRGSRICVQKSVLIEPGLKQHRCHCAVGAHRPGAWPAVTQTLPSCTPSPGRPPSTRTPLVGCRTRCGIQRSPRARARGPGVRAALPCPHGCYRLRVWEAAMC